jgi:hypothetical protein
MRAVRLVGPPELQLVKVAEPTPGPGEVLVRVRACGVCASDLNAWRGVPGIEFPLEAGAPGHETWGEVVELGQSVDALRTGQCVTGMLWNGLAEFGVARAENLVALEAPLLGEPLACAMNVIRRVGSTDMLAFVGFGYLADDKRLLRSPGDWERRLSTRSTTSRPSCGTACQW